MKASQKNITANEGDARDMTCLVENVISAVEWKWLHKDTLIIRDDNGRSGLKNLFFCVELLTQQ